MGHPWLTEASHFLRNSQCSLIFILETVGRHTFTSSFHLAAPGPLPFLGQAPSSFFVTVGPPSLDSPSYQLLPHPLLFALFVIGSGRDFALALTCFSGRLFSDPALQAYEFFALSSPVLHLPSSLFIFRSPIKKSSIKELTHTSTKSHITSAKSHAHINHSPASINKLVRTASKARPHASTSSKDANPLPSSRRNRVARRQCKFPSSQSYMRTGC